MAPTLFRSSLYVPSALSITVFCCLSLPGLPPSPTFLFHYSCLSPAPPDLVSGLLQPLPMDLPASCHSRSQRFSGRQVAKFIFSYRSDVTPPETSPNSLLPTELSTGPSVDFKSRPGYPAYLPIFLANPGHTLCAIAQRAKLSRLCGQTLLSTACLSSLP